ncbi:hypothetical protein TCAL_08987 [Tigriopus californicus]|uniref:Roundabout n=1 Tax=Tigriopus californicus TaxID=6832 RepID=A0A553PL38_TIGCA|nr:hypothetical protein TCAL_08987 [Tigriopus californicus]
MESESSNFPADAFLPTPPTPPPNAHSPPIILEHPTDLIVPENEPVTLTCHAAGTPRPMVQWFRAGTGKVETATQNAGSRRIQLPDGSLFFLGTKETVDAGKYWCEAFNANGIARSKNATLEIAYLKHDFPSDVRPPYLSQEPTFEGISGSNIELPCQPPEGKPQPKVSWKQGDRRLDLGNLNRLSISPNGHLRIRDLQPSDEGSYQCVASNMAGSRESKPMKLNVLRSPFFIRAPQNTSVLIGKDTFLDCVANGEPKPDITWTFNGERLSPSQAHNVPGKGIQFRKATLDHSGTYICSATSHIGTVFARADLYVQEPPVIPVPPQGEVEVKAGTSVTLDCLTNGRPDPMVIWMHEDERTFLLPGDSTDILEVTPRGQLIVQEVFYPMQFICFAVNIVGSTMAKSQISVKSESLELGLSATNLKKRSRDQLQGGVEILEIGGQSPTSIRVAWRLTHPSTDLNLVDGFYILYREADHPEHFSFTSLTVLHAAATSYVVNRLMPFTKYQFVVIPFQRGSAGQASPLIEAFTEEIKPTHAPTHLNWRQVNASSIEIRWDPLNEEKFKGVPQGYQILIYQHNGQIASNLSVPWHLAHVVLSNLEPHHTYHVQIAGFNSQGLGPYSQRLEVRPEPELAYGTSLAASEKAVDNNNSSLGASSWIIPTVICFAVLAVILAGYVIYTRSRGSPRSPTSMRHRHKLRLPSFSATSLSGQKLFFPSRNRKMDVQKEFQLLPSAASNSSSQRPQIAKASSSAETMYLDRRFSSGILARTRRGYSEEDSDYAYIDRSTHSITGYLNSPDERNLSPYATTEISPHQSEMGASSSLGGGCDVMPLMGSVSTTFNDLIPMGPEMGVHQQRRSLGDHHMGSTVVTRQPVRAMIGPRGRLRQPLNVTAYTHAPLHASSDHIYAIVATPEPMLRATNPLFTSFRGTGGMGAGSRGRNSGDACGADDGQIRSSANSHVLESNSSLERPIPNLVDLLPPPPMHQHQHSQGQTTVTTTSQGVLPMDPLLQMDSTRVDTTTDLSDLYSVVKPKNGSNNPSISSKSNSGTSKRRKLRKQSMKNERPPKESDWKDMDDADTSSIDSEEEESKMVNNTPRPDLIPGKGALSPGLPSTSADKRKREKSLPRRKTRGQRDQQRKRSLNQGGPQSLPLSPISPAPGFHKSDSDYSFHEGLLLSSTQAVKQAVREAEIKAALANANLEESR